MSADLGEVAIIFGGGMGAGLAAFVASFRAPKRKVVEEDSKPAIVGGTLLDRRAAVGITEALAAVQRTIERFREQQHEDSRELRQSMEDMAAAVRRNTEAQDGGAVSPRDMLALLARMKGTNA